MAGLILVPTELERARLQPRLGRLQQQVEPTRRQLEGVGGRVAPWRMESCGFGPIAAAARTMALIDLLRPRRVILVGIAGTFDAGRLPVGAAIDFAAVCCDGVGVGAGSDHQSSAALGWRQWEDATAATPSIGDRIELTPEEDRESGDVVGGGADSKLGPLLVTACAASANQMDAAQRLQRWPDAWAEDMEGFGVAVSCRLAGVPLQIVRGISNRVGDRDFARWRTDDALAAAAERVERLVTGRGSTS